MNRALEAAKKKGHQAGLEGKDIRACPYEDWRTGRGSVTWSRAFIHAWFDGFREGCKKRDERAET